MYTYVHTPATNVFGRVGAVLFAAVVRGPAMEQPGDGDRGRAGASCAPQCTLPHPRLNHITYYYQLIANSVRAALPTPGSHAGPVLTPP